jgi:ketosteroid isomerase-like protein
MYKLLTLIAAALISFSAVADQHSAVEAEVRDAAKAFNGAYARNDVEGYFSHFADDATMFWEGTRQTTSGYREEWDATIGAGGAVEKNEVSDLQVRVLPGGDAAIVSFFIDYRMRTPDGEVVEEKAFESEVWQKIDGAWKVVGLHYTALAPA